MNPRRTIRRTTVAAGVIFGLVATLFWVRAPSALAAQMEMKVVIEHVEALDCVDEIETPFGNPCDPTILGKADFYAIVTIAGKEADNKANRVENDDNIDVDWPFTNTVDTTAGTVPVVVEIYDSDSGILSTRGEDDPVDLTSNDADRRADLSVDLNRCSAGDAGAVSGDVSGQCEVHPAVVPLITQGNANDRAKIHFRVEIEHPASLPGKNVRCLHSPIWPDEDDQITITAESLDGSNAAEQADTIEIFVDSRAAPAATRDDASTLTHRIDPRSRGKLNYACRVVDEDGPVSTGWRETHVGPTDDLGGGLQAPVPVLVTESQKGAWDFMFVADRVDFMGANDPNFLTDVHALIRDGYFGAQRGTETFYLGRQKQMNFWISPVTGVAEDAEDGCDHELNYRANFTDAYALVHRREMRDCAPGGEPMFSIESNQPDSPDVLLHETGHRPFGLADEYPPDGGYFQSDEMPNIYEELEDCQADLPNLPGNTTCTRIEEEVDWWFDSDWYVSDLPDSNNMCCDEHLMDDNGPLRPADLRRINTLFDRCLAASC